MICMDYIFNEFKREVEQSVGVSVYLNRRVGGVIDKRLAPRNAFPLLPDVDNPHSSSILFSSEPIRVYLSRDSLEGFARSR